jgi:hypothetical protein
MQHQPSPARQLVRRPQHPSERISADFIARAVGGTGNPTQTARPPAPAPTIAGQPASAPPRPSGFDIDDIQRRLADPDPVAAAPSPAPPGGMMSLGVGLNRRVQP